MEALASIGGLTRAALHSQLAAAVQVVLHMRRLSDGRAGAGRRRRARRRRRRRASCGRSGSGGPVSPRDRDLLGGLLARRGTAVPW